MIPSSLGFRFEVHAFIVPRLVPRLGSFRLLGCDPLHQANYVPGSFARKAFILGSCSYSRHQVNSFRWTSRQDS